MTTLESPKRQQVHRASTPSVQRLSTASRTSSGASRPSSKRSPSPRITFTPSPLPAEKGVQNITRKVIRTLEGLGHLDIMDSQQEDSEEREEQDEVQRGLLPNGKPSLSPLPPSPASRIEAPSTSTNGHSLTRPKKIDWEVPRKVLHSSIGFGTLYLYVSNNSPTTVQIGLWTALAVIIPAEVLRFRSARFERLYETCLGFLMRESEKKQTNGVIWYILGAIFVLSCYPLDIATVAILILSWADTAASTIGRLWGSYTPPLPVRLPLLRLPLAPRKSVAGFIAACLTGACISIAFWGWIAPIRADISTISWTWDAGLNSAGSRHSYNLLSGWMGLGVIGLVSGLITGVAEALDLGNVDDNISLPIIAGGCIWAFFKFLAHLPLDYLA